MGVWHHAVWIYNGKKLSLYLDNVLVEQGIAKGTSTCTRTYRQTHDDYNTNLRLKSAFAKTETFILKRDRRRNKSGVYRITACYCYKFLVSVK